MLPVFINIKHLEEYVFLGCNTLQFEENHIFWRNVLPTYAGSKRKPTENPAEADKRAEFSLPLTSTGFLLGLLFNLKTGGVHFSKTSMDFYHTMESHISEDCALYNYITSLSKLLVQTSNIKSKYVL
jgi:hypothetical protein